jgi:hypothetical protein
MRLARWLACWVTGALAVCGAVAAAACATSNGDTGKDLPSATPAQFCTSFKAYATKCNDTDPCSAGLVQNCNSYSVAFSASYLAAFVQCSASEPGCLGEFASGAPGSFLTANASEDTCLAAAQVKFAPTDAQQKYAQDYCAECGAAEGLPSGAACAQSFYTLGDGGTTMNELAAVPFDFDDTLVSAFDQECIPTGPSPSAESCAGDFYECVNTLVAKAIPPPGVCLGEPPDGGDGG